MKKSVVIIFAVLIYSTAFAQKNPGEIIGIWETEAKDGKMEIYKTGNEYRGKLLWGKDIVEKDSKTSKKDVKNPDEKLRSRNLVGITYITGLIYDDNEYVDGSVYSAADGRTYDCKLWIENEDLYLRGYVGFSLLGQTSIWKRLD